MKITADHLTHVSSVLLQAAGVGAEEARLVAENLVSAELRGIPTHGINFLPLIVERIQRGLVTVPTELQVIVDQQAITHIDGGNGLGQTAAREGMRRSIDKAQRFGVGLSLIRNTNHIGHLAFYSLMAAAENMIGICMCNGAPSMAPWGGAEPFFGSNPFSIACPGGSEAPIVLDMSTSVVARGKIRRAARNKERIPFGWALDAAGVPTDDPVAALAGTLVPLGEHKGYGMALFIDLICGLLSGSKYAREVKTFHKPEGPTGIGVMTMAVNIEWFMPRDRFASLIEAYIRDIRASKKARGNPRIYLPGEIEFEKESLHRRQGVEIDPLVAKTIEGLLERMGLAIRLNDGELPA